MPAKDQYRVYAAECLRLAGEVQHPKDRLVLLAMAQMWFGLADQAENSRADLVYVTPPRTLESSAAVAQQQQQSLTPAEPKKIR